MGDDTLIAFFANADAVAQRIQEWNEYRLKQEIAAKERTIDIQVEKTSDAKANKLAYQKLEKIQAWNEAQLERQKLRQKHFEQCKGLLFWVGGWVGSGRSGIFFFISAVLISTTATVVPIINLPTNLSCPDTKSLCYLVYQMRFNNKSVILPGQAKDIVAEYERNKSKSKRRK
ncbi:hypothetical protein CDG77_17285 [Nostoc sp. 'Peltigera membranacea cyanobiont' 213]|uniref:hypothetical protein n=1 Tax=Nostoc sp. 'Peltigera membranacea cyanobiont' 213 TaxID=2014530 RepID=UPI000B95B875|nr:hypothetical protein [Nostoc sp. 'Peltigera membranacea cyanobiont' 213]OYD90429.1 hypothetical protein CDG77_17285 [Nostoc sp. 'Peltigera membranacea cyanobiont' 213]